MTVLLDVERRWICPNCDHSRVTNGQPGVVIHTCGGLRGLIAPLVPEGTRCKIEAVLREDYVLGDTPQRDAEGRPIMAIVTTRDDGQDCRVLAPVSTSQGRTR